MSLMQQKLRVLHETFFAGKIALKQNLRVPSKSRILTAFTKVKEIFYWELVYFGKKKQPLLPFLRFTAVWNRFVQEQERPFILKYIRGSTVFDAFLMSRHGFYHGLRKIFTVIFKAQNR